MDDADFQSANGLEDELSLPKGMHFLWIFGLIFCFLLTSVYYVGNML